MGEMAIVLSATLVFNSSSWCAGSTNICYGCMACNLTDSPFPLPPKFLLHALDSVLRQLNPWPLTPGWKTSRRSTCQSRPHSAGGWCEHFDELKNDEYALASSIASLGGGHKIMDNVFVQCRMVGISSAHACQ